MGESEEQVFISLLQAHDESAFKDLVLQNQDRVYNLCLHYLNNEEEAEDIAQEVFIEIHQSIHSFNKKAKLSTWIYRLAVNKSLERLRYYKRAKRFAWLTSLFGKEEKYEANVGEWIHPGVEEENKERSKILYNALKKLPDNQQSAFVLHKIDGMSYKEISEVLKLSLSSVESLMHRAKKNLQKQLKDYYER